MRFIRRFAIVVIGLFLLFGASLAGAQQKPECRCGPNTGMFKHWPGLECQICPDEVIDGDKVDAINQGTGHTPPALKSEDQKSVKEKYYDAMRRRYGDKFIVK